MGKYKLIAFDMDGTLLDSKKEIRPESLEAIRVAAAAGKYVCLSTGRPRPEVEYCRSMLPKIHYVIGASGAFVRNFETGKMIFSGTIEPDTAAEVLRRVKGEDLMVQLFSEQSVSQRDKIPHMADYHMGQYQPMVEKITVPVEDIIEYYLAAPYPLDKLNLYCRDTDRRLRLRGLLGDIPLEMVDSEETSLELSAPGISKGRGLTELCAHLGITPEETIAVGDGNNDIEIMKTAGLAIAMGNAIDAVKACADVVVSDCDHDGCARAIYDYLLQ